MGVQQAVCGKMTVEYVFLFSRMDEKHRKPEIPKGKIPVLNASMALQGFPNKNLQLFIS